MKLNAFSIDAHIREEIVAASRLSRLPLLLIAGAASLVAVVLFFLSLRLYDGLSVGVEDQGYYQQALYNTAHGRLFEISVSSAGYTHFFSDHVYIFLLAFVPIYAL